MVRISEGSDCPGWINGGEGGDPGCVGQSAAEVPASADSVAAVHYVGSGVGHGGAVGDDVALDRPDLLGRLFGDAGGVGGEYVVLIDAPARAAVGLGEYADYLAEVGVGEFSAAEGLRNEQAEEAFVGHGGW